MSGRQDVWVMKRKLKKPRSGLRLDLHCTCGGTLRSDVPIRPTDAIRMRDIYLSFHQEAGCEMTDSSKDAP